MKHLTNLFDITSADARDILQRSADLKRQDQAGQRPQLLTGKVLAQVFEKPSLRTRVSFEAAFSQLGGAGLFMSAKDAGLDGRESNVDVARVLGGYADVIVLRTFSQTLIETFAQHAGCPVINGLSDEYHPCQALTDALTIQEACGDLAGRRIAYVGDGNNVAVSLAIISAMLDMSLVVSAPPGYELSDDFLSELKQKYPAADVRQIATPQDAVQDADVIYTDVWASMGQESEKDARKKVFADYQVNEQLLAAASPDCRFLHCLPARRGLEVTDGVMESAQCLAFDQAENRMHLAKGLFAWLLG